MMSHLKSMVAGGLLALFAGAALAQAPVVGSSEPMRFIVPFPPGGTLDVLARTVANELGPALGRAIVVENKSGASGARGARGSRRQYRVHSVQHARHPARATQQSALRRF